jgi:microcystin degradation protein MlrC
MKLFTALLGTETNTFSPFATGFHNFEQTLLVRHGDHGDAPTMFSIPLVVWRRRGQERGWQVVESLAAFATPAGATRRDVYETYRDEILADLQSSMPVDAVLLNLHGAMVADGCDDCEGDLLGRVRKIVGPKIPIGAELDLHCHLTQKMVEQADVLVTFKEYPHTDFAERAEELFSIITDTLGGRVRPRMSLHDCGMFGVFHTTTEPMSGFVDRMAELEGRDGVLSVSLAHGFPWGDVPDMGTRTLVVTDDREREGAALARSLGDALFGMRERLSPEYLSIDEALDHGVGHPSGPVVLGDVSDNSGGGAPNDSTFILRRMLERGIENAAVACIWDPVAVTVAAEAGEGATLELRLGGKMGTMSGDPLDVKATVTRISSDGIQYCGEGAGRATFALGEAAALRVEGIEVVVNSLRVQTFSPEAFTSMGVEPTDKQILVVKSMQHFHAGFAPIAADIRYVAAPGATLPRFDQLPYRRINCGMWPLAGDATS